jgi:hypothetical protein
MLFVCAGMGLKGAVWSSSIPGEGKKQSALMDLLAKPLPETVEVQAIIINTVWKAKVANLKLNPVKDDTVSRPNQQPAETESKSPANGSDVLILGEVHV